MKDKTRQETKKRHRIDEKNFAIESFDVVSFHETKAKKTEKERKREKDGTKRKQKKKDKKEERKKRTRETEKEKLNKWKAKKGSGETKGDTQN